MINSKNYRRKKNSTVFLPLVIARLFERKEKCIKKKKASVSIAIAKDKISKNNLNKKCTTPTRRI